MRPFLILTAVVLLAFSVTFAEEQEKKVSESQVPQAVLKAFADSYPGATVKEYAEEKEDDKTFYEISCEYEGRKIDVSYNVDGFVTEVEETISENELPDAVKAAIGKEFKNASIQLAEKKLKDGKTFYEVKLTAGDDLYEVLYTNAGKQVEKAEMDEDEGEQEGEE